MACGCPDKRAGAGHAGQVSDAEKDPSESWRLPVDEVTSRSPDWRAEGARPEIVYLDPHAERPVSQYSPEGEIRMMGDFAAGLTRGKSGASRPMAYALVIIVLLPIVISVIALLSTWL